MDEKKFARIEKKYLIDAAAKGEILGSIQKKMQKDKYFESEILNIYFDTDNFDLIIRSIENPDFKEKFRARSYAGYDKVFLEIKTKLKTGAERVGHKRRILLTHKDYRKFAQNKKLVEELIRTQTKNDVQIAREIDYLVSYFDLKPKILVYYERESYVGEEDLRITFDKNLRYRNHDLNFKRKTTDKCYFDDEKNIIMEVKARGAIPLWLAKVLSEHKIYPQRFSKIGKIYEKIRKEQNV